jgi:hypothetical protein
MAGGELLEDAAHDSRFDLIDLATAMYGIAIGIDFANDFVAICDATAGTALPNPALQPPPGFLGEVLDVERVHGALEADMKLGDLTLRQGE